uniref:ABC transporter domain-containing protein n=1 Tax=Angiostrongylus cantonensis TaxID=6313 RepID=A0A0K0CZL9_ANGCA
AYSKESLAVRNVTFAVDKGECFGLLGLNGAGKTTTFSILTQKIRPGSGSVLIHGRNWICTSRSSSSPVTGERSTYDHVGYCPQFDAMNMKLTTNENIELFARIRGIPEEHIPPLVNRLLVSLHLQPYASTITSALSGGNRRKLSVATALISHPSLVLLDEPSAGMDPNSQRFLWRVIGHLRKSGKAVVITSHSMEECEALCTRIAIMDRGQIRCIGSKQHLKNK